MHLKINIIWKIAAILYRPQCGKKRLHTLAPTFMGFPLPMHIHCDILWTILELLYLFHRFCWYWFQNEHYLNEWFSVAIGICLDNDDVIKWNHFPRHRPYVRGLHRSPVNSQHKSQWRWVLMFSLIYAWINAWVNNREFGDLRRYRAHYDVIVMPPRTAWLNPCWN